MLSSRGYGWGSLCFVRCVVDGSGASAVIALALLNILQHGLDYSDLGEYFPRISLSLNQIVFELVQSSQNTRFVLLQGHCRLRFWLKKQLVGVLVLHALVSWIEVFSEVQCFDTDFEAVVEVVAGFEFAETRPGNPDVF